MSIEPSHSRCDKERKSDRDSWSGTWTHQAYTELISGDPPHTSVRVDPVYDSFVRCQHLWSSRSIGMNRDL